MAPFLVELRDGMNIRVIYMHVNLRVEVGRPRFEGHESPYPPVTNTD